MTEIIGTYRTIPKGTKVWSIQLQENIIFDRDVFVEINQTCIGSSEVFCTKFTIIFDEIKPSKSVEFKIDYYRTVEFKKPAPVFGHMEMIQTDKKFHLCDPKIAEEIKNHGEIISKEFDQKIKEHFDIESTTVEHIKNEDSDIVTTTVTFTPKEPLDKVEFDLNINPDVFIIESFKMKRLEKNERERIFFEEFNQEINHFSKHKTDLDAIVFGTYNGFTPKGKLTEHEQKIVLSAIQWLGTSVGRQFLNRCGYMVIK